MRRIGLIVALLVVAVLAGAYAFGTGGMPDREPPDWLTAQKIAHRGQWTDSGERPENSLTAFAEAVENGYAVELDVQWSLDGEIMVFHDASLERMTGVVRPLADMPSFELRRLSLLGGDQRIPTLSEVLALVDGRVPVFVEIKNEGEIGALEDAVVMQLDAYNGPVCVMSFNPFSLQRVAELAPDIPRGQLASRFKGENLAWYEKLLLANMAMNWASKPDFIAYDIDALPCPGVAVQRWRGRPILGWTIEDADDLARAEELVDGFICNPGALD